MRGEGYSLADIAAATGNGGNNGGNNGFGNGEGAWWIIIFLIFAFLGWGRNGFGGNNGSGTDGSGAAMNYVLSSDFATLQRLLSDGFNNLNDAVTTVNEGLCNGFYNMNTTLLNGFNGVNQNIMNGNFNLQSAINSCCCDVREGISGVNYNLSQVGCGITNAINMAARDITDNQNANYRALHDEIVANRIEDKNAQITAQQNQITALQLAASQAQQNQYLLNELKPCPIPAYITCNPYQSYSLSALYGNNGCGCGCGTSL